ncbi:MAG: hypothetical protein ACR2JY_04325 [Chloroflexota bacterium]
MCSRRGAPVIPRVLTMRRRSHPHIARPLPRHRHEDGEELEDLDVIGGPASPTARPEGTSDASE